MDFDGRNIHCTKRVEYRNTRVGVRRRVYDDSVGLAVRGLDFMDSAGVGFVIGRYKIMRRRGGSVAVLGAEGAIDRIFSMSGLYQIIERLA